MRNAGTPTKYPGIYRIDDNTYRARAKVLDQRTGKTKEIDRVLRGVTARDAADLRGGLIKEAQAPTAEVQRLRVGEFAKSWMKSKTLKLDPTTAATYADALDRHILPALGTYFYDAITPMDVQRWIDDAIVNGWKTPTDEVRTYSPRTVHVWFRVFRTMTRDAISMLALPRDPTLRISFPDAAERGDENALTADQLARFLTEMRERYPQHYALVVLLAYTGLRFCHASALHWEDWDEEGGVLRVRRKQVRGELGKARGRSGCRRSTRSSRSWRRSFAGTGTSCSPIRRPVSARGTCSPRRLGPCACRAAWTRPGRSASRRPRSTSASPCTGSGTRSPTSPGWRTSTRSCGERSPVTSPRRCSAATRPSG